MPDPFHLAAQLGAALVFVLAAGFLGASFLIWLSAKLCRVEKSGFGRAMLATGGELAAAFVGSVLFSAIATPMVGTLLGIAVSVLILKSAFATGLGRAFLVWMIGNLIVIAGGVVACFVLGALLVALA